MITNERQYRITKAQVARLRVAIATFNLDSTITRTGSAVLARAELEALRSEEQGLCQQLLDYETLKAGDARTLGAATLEELPTILIRARIARGLSQGALAKRLHLKEQQIQRYESEEYASASLRRLVEIAGALDLDISEVAEIRPPRAVRRPPSSPPTDWDRFPIKEMYRRAWFEDIGFSGSQSAALANGAALAMAYVERAMPRRQPAFLRHRARFGSEMNWYALWAWQCRVVIMAGKESLPNTFSRNVLSQSWLRDLAHQSRLPDGPVRAKEMLARVGIPLIIEPHLPQTYLDGAVFLLPSGRPVIGMTARFDRLDNYWFVLFHELGHIVQHLRKGKLETIFDDLETDRDAFETAADSFASAALIPTAAWEVALARYLRTAESVVSFAEAQGVHPAIVAGRIRREACNYVMLSDLVGSGEVRRHFPEVRFDV
jgi:HTH-type transcriptional regulator/antitoxin HigA